MSNPQQTHPRSPKRIHSTSTMDNPSKPTHTGALVHTQTITNKQVRPMQPGHLANNQVQPKGNLQINSGRELSLYRGPVTYVGPNQAQRCTIHQFATIQSGQVAACYTVSPDAADANKRSLYRGPVTSVGPDQAQRCTINHSAIRETGRVEACYTVSPDATDSNPLGITPKQEAPRFMESVTVPTNSIADAGVSLAKGSENGFDSFIDAVDPPEFPEDSISAIQLTNLGNVAPQELRITCHILGRQTEALIDTGAGYGYIVTNDLDIIPHTALQPYYGSIRLADGSSTCQIQGLVECVVDIELSEKSNRKLQQFGVFRVLHVPDALSPFRVIIGRTLIQQWGLQINGVHTVRARDGSLLFGEPSDECCALYDIPEPVEACQFPSREVLPEMKVVPPIRQVEPVVAFKFSLTEEKAIQKMVDTIRAGGWQDITLCPGYKMRLRPLKEGDRPDAQGQTHLFEVQFPQFESSGVRTRRYARPFYNKLTPDVQKKFLELISEYLSEKWWWIKDRARLNRDTRILPVANIFCVGGGESRQKLRLVCDLRPANACLPAVSSQTDPIIRILLNVLMSAPPCVVVSDARAAFYKIKTDGNVLIELEGPTDVYLSDRITFGISSGPGICNFALGSLRRVLLPELSAAVSAFNLFVDDSVMCGRIQDVNKGFRKWIGLLDQTGNDITMRKLRVLSADEEDARKQFDLPVSPQARLLGLLLYYRGNQLVLDCSRGEARKAALEFVSNVSATRITTKRAVFELAGRLGYDPLNGHAVERAVADALRSVFGALALDWKGPICIDSLSIVERNCVETIFDWILDEFPHLPPCDHAVQVKEPSVDVPHEISFVGCSDASDSGGSYVLYMNGLKISERAWFWKGTTLGALDVNLKELEAHVLLMTECARIMPAEQDRDFTMQRFRFKFQLYCDNRAVCAWLQSGREISSVLGMRRILTARDLLCKLRPVAVVQVSYLEGYLNSEADRLSRLFDRPSKFNCKILLSSLLSDRRYAAALVENFTPDREEDLMAVADSEPLQPTLASNVSAEDPTFRGLLDGVHWLRTVLRSWRNRPGNMVESSQYEDEISLVRVFQATELKGALKTYFRCPESIPASSPIRFEADMGILTRRIPRADGSSYFVPLIPQGSSLAKAIARKVHEEAGHAGVLATKLRIEAFYYIPAVTKLLSSLLHFCVVCQRVRARQAWQVEPAVSMHGLTMEHMAACNAFTFVGIDYLAVGDGIKIFSVTCLFSRSVWWRVVDSEDLITAVVSLRMAQAKFGKIDTVVSDQGSYFRSERFLSRLKKEIGEVKVVLIPPRSPWVGGVYEREHQEGLKLAKVLLATLNKKTRDLRFGLVTLQERVDRLTLIMNTRPLGVNLHGIVITPDLLAFGNTRRLHDFAQCRQGQDIAKVRRFFLDHAWKHLKARAWISIASRSNPPGQRTEIGQLKEGDQVLVFQQADKIDPVTVGTFVRLQDRRVWVRIGDKLLLEHHYNVIPIETSPEYPQPDMDTVQPDVEMDDASEEGAELDIPMDEIEAERFEIGTPPTPQFGNPSGADDAEVSAEEMSADVFRSPDPELHEDDGSSEQSLAESRPRDFACMTDPIPRTFLRVRRRSSQVEAHETVPDRLTKDVPNVEIEGAETVEMQSSETINENQEPSNVAINENRPRRQAAVRALSALRALGTTALGTTARVTASRPRAQSAISGSVVNDPPPERETLPERPRRKAAAKANEAWLTLKGRAC